MNYTVELEVPALQSCLHAVTACLSRICRVSVGDDNQEFQRAVHEACCNAIRQGYGGDNANARLLLNFTVGENEVAVELVDFGLPSVAISPDPTRTDQSPRADEVRYQRIGDRNLRTLLCRARQRA